MVEPPAVELGLVTSGNDTHRRSDQSSLPMLSKRGDYMVVKQAKGMLSTSPGTGGALMHLLTGRARLTNDGVDSNKKVDTSVAEASKMLAAAEDVGRRAISVAHLGDHRAYTAMRLVVMGDSGSGMTPMEGIEEEAFAVTDDSSMASFRRRRGSSSATDRSMADAAAKIDNEVEEMPFALESPPLFSTGIPTRESVASFTKESSITRALVKPSPGVIRMRFSDALSCYLKALTMLKGAVAAAQQVAGDLESLPARGLAPEKAAFVGRLKKRCQVTMTWLGEQFRGVLERADAANVEISKLAPTQSTQDKTELLPAVSAEELIYNHALAFGREGTVKQLLGQNEAARASYRTAGLLAETLLMESGMGADDRKVLEDYVEGFAARITELDTVMVQESRMVASSAVR
jgi:hypothetical protein